MTEETQEKNQAESVTPAQKEGSGVQSRPEQALASETQERQKTDSSKDASKTQVLLKKQYRIYPMRPLPSLDMPTAKAYSAEDLKDPNRKIYALVVPPNIPLNYDNLKEIPFIHSPCLLPFVDMGTVFWHPFSKKTKVVLYEQPLGGRVMEEDSKCLPFNEQDLLSTVFPSLLSVVELFSSKSITHRAIRPSNMYYMDEEKRQIVLGDCLTVPPAFEQSEVLETIPSAMCLPAGRGKGTVANDLYSLAVSMIFLALGRNPMEKMSSFDVVLMKIRKGSYGALLENNKVYLSLVELLRGVLSDDPKFAWDLKTVKMWLDGASNVRLFQVEKKQSSQRPFLFAGKEYFSYRSLAFAFSENWNLAAEAICSERLSAWVTRGFNDAATMEKINRAIQTAKTSYASAEEQESYIITKTCMILDLQAPLRTKNYRLMPDGLGALLAMHALNKEDASALYALISGGFLEMWYDVRDDKTSRQQIRSLQKILSLRDYGMGKERCLYELNDALPCLSPMVEDEYIDDVRQILPSLEKIAGKADAKSWPIDRHIIAYVAKHFTTKISAQMFALNRPKAAVATGGMLSLLAMLQWTYGPEVLYGLTTWVGGLVSPIIESYHSKTKQKSLEKELPKYIRKGNLAALYRFLDSAEEREMDDIAFNEAKAKYAEIVAEIKSLEDHKEEHEEYAATLGYQVATILSFSVAVLVMFFMLIYRFMRV